MRLLDTHTGFFVEKDPHTTEYAILSHTWDPEGEQSYQDLLRLQEDAKSQINRLPKTVHTDAAKSKRRNLASRFFPRTRAGLHPRDSTGAETADADSSPSILDDPGLSPKIKGLCKTAREAGYRYVWDDTCCIDKTSSAELSQAINSMYEWYRLANRCYVYLSDVLDGDDPRKPDSEFSRSRWHKRGWTLQELIAPGCALSSDKVFFYSSTWTRIGNREDLADTLERVTGVDARVLTGKVSVHNIPVARRMWWASKRETTRVEDEAYCLLGVFGIHMSPIYGEGQNAFIRLQRKIMRTIPDQTIFAWGLPAEIRAFDDYCLTLSQSPHLLRSSEDDFRNNGLLALSPRDFRYSGGLVPLSTVKLFDRLAWKPKDSDFKPLRTLQYTFAADGIHVSFPCVDLSALPGLRRTLRQIQQTLPPSTAISESGRRTRCNSALCNIGSLVLLLCQTSDGRLVALPLPSSSLSPSDAGLSVGLHCDECLECDVQDSRTLYLSDPVIQAVSRLIKIPRDICIRQGSTPGRPPREVPELTRYDGVEGHYYILRIRAGYQCSESGCLTTPHFYVRHLQNERMRNTLQGNLCSEICWSASLVPTCLLTGAAFSLEHSERIEISVHVLEPKLWRPVIRPEADAWHRARIVVSNHTRNRARAVVSPPSMPAPAMAPGDCSRITSDACAPKDVDVPLNSPSPHRAPTAGPGTPGDLSCERQSCDVVLGEDGKFRCAFNLRLAVGPRSADDVERDVSSVGPSSAQEQEFPDHDGLSLRTLHVSSTILSFSTNRRHQLYNNATLILFLRLSPAPGAIQALHAA